VSGDVESVARQQAGSAGLCSDFPLDRQPDCHTAAMRWADLVLAYSRVYIWPIVVVVLVLVFRPQLGTVLGRFAERIKDLKSVRALGAAIDFDQGSLDNKRDLANIVGGPGVPQPEIERMPPRVGGQMALQGSQMRNCCLRKRRARRAMPGSTISTRAS
jgi:hypothetical protein